METWALRMCLLRPRSILRHVDGGTDQLDSIEIRDHSPHDGYASVRLLEHGFENWDVRYPIINHPAFV